MAMNKTLGYVISTAMVTAIIVLVPVTPASADAIDGKWCHKDGRNLSINGPNIVTPGGVSMKGNYGRHSFDYIAPKRDRSPGTKITMNLESDHKMLRQIGKKPVENWTRCRPVS